MRIHQFDLQLKHRFTIARGSTTVQPTLIVELIEDGHHGFGEATVNPYYGATYEAMIAALEDVRPHLESLTLSDPVTLWSDLASRLATARSQESGARSPQESLDPLSSILAPHYLFALCALDEAAHDLWGKKLGAPVWKLWGLSIDEKRGARSEGREQSTQTSILLPQSCFTIGIDSVDRMVAKLHEMPGWPIYKIKLGGGRQDSGARSQGSINSLNPDSSLLSPPTNDLAIVRELRRHTDATFRVDANCGWTVDETLRNAPELAALGVEFIEQPLPADDWEGHRRLFEKSPLPIIADESCIREGDVERCHGHFHGINIKLMKCGGLTPARRMIDRARALGLKVMVGCMTESSVGISAIAQLLPLLDYVDMDGAALLARDVATGVRLDRGRCIYADENGTGARLLT